jgi:hypothetical protein
MIFTSDGRAARSLAGFSLVQRTKKLPCCGRPPQEKGPPGVRRTFSGPDRTWGLGGGDQEGRR